MSSNNNLDNNPQNAPENFAPTPEYFTPPAPNYQQIPNYQQPEILNNSTIQPPKSKKILIISLAAVILIIITGVLIFLNYPKQIPAQTNIPAQKTQTSFEISSATSSQNSTISQKVLVTGGPETPASKAKINVNTQILPAWLDQKFATISGAVENSRCVLETVCGEATDYDKDGLSNLYESNYGTDPLDFDTDKDGLADGDELIIYYTDPTKADSDTDSFKDSDELGNCYDPIIIEKAKISKARRQAIESNVEFKSITGETIKAMIAKGYYIADQKLGYASSKCTPAIPTSSTIPVAKP
jgi:hypothetical protein